MHINAWESQFSEDLTQSLCSGDTLDEDHHLVELDLVQDVIGELLVLLVLGNLRIELRDTFQNKAGFVVDEDFLRLLEVVLSLLPKKVGFYVPFGDTWNKCPLPPCYM